MSKHVVIIGGGAAGFFTAINLKQMSPSARVTILEKGNKVLSKVRISGGGRCNVTHSCFDNGLLVQHYPRGAKALRSAFSRFSVPDTIAWFGERGVTLKTETDGRMFPDTDSSETIVNCLLREAEKAGVEMKMGADVKKISKIGEAFLLAMNGGGELTADQLVIACGGYPKAESYSWLRDMGHKLSLPVPSLFTFNVAESGITKLMGLSVPDATVRIEGLTLTSTGPLLITHWGFSGPSVLRLSAWAARELNDKNYQFNVRIAWTGNRKEDELRLRLTEVRTTWNARQIAVHPLFDLPKRLWEYLVTESGIGPELKWADLPKKNMNKLIEKLLNDIYPVKGKTTFKEEFVTCGGIALEDVDFRTMESHRCPGIFFAGEVLDIDGVTGGFNFQSAWTTGWIAAQALGRKDE
jgi:predicted Rossmann fold flavoprotein